MVSLHDEGKYLAYKYPRTAAVCKTLLWVFTCPLCCCFCCFCGRLPNMRRRRGCVRTTREEREARDRFSMTDIHYQHKERRLKRRQSLSIGSPTSGWRKLRKKPTSDQASCPLFAKLPVEIRERIYEYVLLGSGAVEWYFTPTEKRKAPPLESKSCVPTNGGIENIPRQTTSEQTGASGCSLLQTCRLIYTEALPILYCNMQFVFRGTGPLKAFSRITSPSKLQMIRSARVDLPFGPYGSPDGIETFQSWKNLRSLYVITHINYGYQFDAYLSMYPHSLPLADHYDLWHLVFVRLDQPQDRDLEFFLAHHNYFKASSG